jgi:hypothetical protein
MKTLKATLWAIDREDYHPILGMPLLKREGLYLDLAIGEFRFRIQPVKVEFISARDF